MRRFTHAQPAPVTRLVDPGPIESGYGQRPRPVILAYAAAMWTAFCSFFTVDEADRVAVLV